MSQTQAAPQDPQLADNPLYLQRKERADADKPPSRSTALGAVASVRFPGTSSRREMMKGILGQDGDLVTGHFGTVHYRPVTIAMWDNRAVLHSASGDFWPHRRLMERLTILDWDASRRAPYYAPVP